MAVRITASTENAERKLQALQRNLRPAKMDRVLATAAWRIHGKLVLLTPKKWTGHTRQGWTVTRIRAGHFAVWNRSKVMNFLEWGTSAHGPKRSKFLFIPLNRKTARAGSRAVGSSGFIFGRDYILKKRVRGIRPKYIVTNFVPRAKLIVSGEINHFIRRIVNSVN